MKTEELRKKTCCFTGHRELAAEKRPEIARRTAEAVRRLILERGVRFFGVGGAVGYDTLAAEVLFRLREREFPCIKVILVYPFGCFANRPGEYTALLPKFDKIVRIGKSPGREACLARNRHLVDGAAYCIAYCTRTKGGTAYTLDYAGRQGLTVCNLADL